MCAHLMVVISVLLIFATLPFSLCLVVKVVQVWQSFSFLGTGELKYLEEYDHFICNRAVGSTASATQGPENTSWGGPHYGPIHPSH